MLAVLALNDSRIIIFGVQRGIRVMTTPKRTRPEHLRADAEGRLRTGTAPPSAGWTVRAEALSLPYRLASNPDNSVDPQKQQLLGA